jgi:hypothetical protein
VAWGLLQLKAPIYAQIHHTIAALKMAKASAMVEVVGPMPHQVQVSSSGFHAFARRSLNLRR